MAAKLKDKIPKMEYIVIKENYFKIARVEENNSGLSSIFRTLNFSFEIIIPDHKII